MQLAPVILFAFNRPEHTKETLVYLKNNVLADQSILYIFIDGPKEHSNVEQIQKINAVKKVAREQQWCKEVRIIESTYNKGLASAITQGVTDILNKYGKVIVLEDDLITDKWFLKYMNDALDIYEFERAVICITGYIYPVSKPLPQTFLLKGADCWGWATWKRGWEVLRKNGKELLDELESKKLTADFNFNNSYPYMQMLKDQINGTNDSWAILWYASAYLKNKYTLYPSHSLVHNIGVDGSGTHSGISRKFDTVLRNEEIIVERLKIEENKSAKKIVEEYFSSLYQTSKTSIFKKILAHFKSA